MACCAFLEQQAGAGSSPSANCIIPVNFLMNRISQSFESSYTTEVTTPLNQTDYIRRLYATVLTPDQRKQL